MGESKHTRWVFRSSGRIVAEEDRRRTLLIAYAGDEVGRIAAAAPQMLEALRALQVVGPAVTPGGCWCPAWVTARATGEHDHGCALARAAIKAAGGGQ